MDSAKLDSLKELLAANVCALVDTPTAVVITCEETAESICFTVRTRANEVGQLVGRNGRIGYALRTLIKSATKKEVKLPVYLSIESL